MRKTLVIVALLVSGAASAHDWYPRSCCSDQDCHPVPCDQLSERDHGGVEYTPTGKLFAKERVYPSQDSSCHACIHGESPVCVFVPQGT